MQSDNQLIKKIQRKQDREAANLLVERYYKEIYAFAFRQAGEKELAMDLTQEIFITILQAISSFDAKKAGFRTWAYRIAANKITDYYRSLAHRSREMEESFAGAGDSCFVDGESDKLYLNQDVEKLVIQRETIRQVMEVVASYDREWMQIFQKKCFFEMTFQEISEEMGLSVNTVKTRFYKMVKKVREHVEGGFV